ncbi:hypothetical protein, partial [Enterococcus casseliflavus]|uniref:hypothetical protein n=1 Tax=Enterococcus casseliflavus TaxID=37734 RepID=UPI003D0C838D
KTCAHDVVVATRSVHQSSAAAVNPLPGDAKRDLQMFAMRSVQFAPNIVASMAPHAAAFAQYFAASVSHWPAVPAGPPAAGGGF